MRVQVLSDLHLEIALRADRPKPVPDGADSPLRVADDADLVVLAGDILSAARPDLMRWLGNVARAADRPFVYVPGNHEFYGCEYHEALENLYRFFSGTPIYVLHDEALVMNGVRFLGTTLWSDFAAGVDAAAGETRADAMAVANRYLNDSRRISIDTPQGRVPFDAAQALEKHVEARYFLETMLTQPFDGKTVVITHHAPCIDASMHPGYPLGLSTGGFASELSHLLPDADVWIWGHTHANVDIRHNQTRLLSNQAGYPGEAVPGGFDALKTIDI
ncbi:hypothetical protein BI364_06880 [Acidihalobacter yilgarnensis]|uniref:Calcineurin-like phosphoesterase domain-containing protein n=1 Tax=Acidihalobacter yilgarnensis TaxID=2819280 RepID=A0A1D8IMM3_9GAMM|nr:metallophosphoesterase [Acidihalobacter yilgarnensis]AOU97718.1 hypothetical protein BI364_06880 [Acidihalobacter yilgarnensis]